MTLNVLGSLYLLVVLLFLLVRGIKFAFPTFGSMTPVYHYTYPTVPDEKRISSRPDQPKKLHASVGIKSSETKEINQPLMNEASRIEIPTGQPEPSSNPGETNIAEIMQEVDRLLALDHITDEDKEALATHQRGYFAHQHAAKSQLSEGNMDGFRLELKCAEYELADLEIILRKHQSDLVKQGQKLFFV